MQPHTGAYILALHNYLNGNKQDKYQVSMTSPKRKRYSIIVNRDSGSSMELQVQDFWSCYGYFRISGRMERTKRIDLKHQDQDNCQPSDYFKLSERQVDGETTSSEGKRTKFSGYFSGLTELTINTVLKNGKSVQDVFHLN